MAILHKQISNTAIKLSVYSAVLDFGLTLSVILLNSKYLPIKVTAYLVNIFDNAIAYLSLIIIAMFGIAFILKHKEHIVNLYTNTNYKPKNILKIKVYAYPKVISTAQLQATIQQKHVPKDDDYTVQRVVNSRNESFIRFNGNWYKSNNDRFDRVFRPDYSK